MTGGELTKEYACADRQTLVSNLLDIQSNLNLPFPTTVTTPSNQSEASTRGVETPYRCHVLDMMCWMDTQTQTRNGAQAHSQSHADSHARRIGCLLTHQLELLYSRYNTSNLPHAAFWEAFLFPNSTDGHNNTDSRGVTATSSGPETVTCTTLLTRYISLSCTWLQQIVRCRQRDYKKGTGIIPDYHTSHTLILPSGGSGDGIGSGIGSDARGDASMIYANSDAVIQNSRQNYLKLEIEVLGLIQYISQLPVSLE